MLISTEPGGALRVRPEYAHDDGAPIDVTDRVIGPLTDVKGLHLSCSWEVERDRWVTAAVARLRRMQLGHVRRSEAAKAKRLHIDAALFNGMNTPTMKGLRPSLLLEDLIVHDCGDDRGVPTILVKDGAWDAVHLRRVFVVRSAAAITLWGPIGNVLIEDSPGIHVNLQGAPGSIGGVTVRRCPGALVQNAKDQHGVHPGAQIAFESPFAWPRPAIATVAVRLTDGSTFNLKGVP